MPPGSSAPGADVPGPSELHTVQSTPPNAAYRAMQPAYGDVALALTLGVLLGAFAVLGDRVPALSVLAQLATPWVLTAAVVGALSRAGLVRAASFGAALLAVASTAYALAGLVIYQRLLVHYWLIWTAVALVVGPAAAVTGWQVRHGVLRMRVVGASALAAVCLAEAFVLWGHIDHPDPHVVYAVMAVVGALIPSAVLRRQRWQVAAGATALGCGLAVPFALILEVAFRGLGIV